MNHAIILAGGLGSRMALDIPKQYFEVKGSPIILYSFRRFSSNPLINSILFIVTDEWRDYVEHIIAKEHFAGMVFFAQAGKSRQHSVYNGLIALKDYSNESDIVLIHDGVRPLFPDSIIRDGINACQDYDGALPVVSVKDATYQSHDGINISTILPRQELFSGQSPECFVYGRYLDAHSRFSDEELSNIRGCAELAYKAGLKIKIIKGSERNFKITTIEDLHAFESLI